MAGMETIGKQVVFSGRVQGVGFRFTARRAASRYGLSGYVKNCPDGTVEAVFQGSPENIQACLQDLRHTFGRNIQSLKADRRPVNPRYHDFETAYGPGRATAAPQKHPLSCRTSAP